MPQASLLSYFSKPVTSGSSPTSNDTDRKVERCSRDERVPDSETSTTEIRGLGILEKLRGKSFQELTCNNAELLSGDTNINVNENKDSLKREPASEPNGRPCHLQVFSQTELEIPQSITIAHLPNACIGPVLEPHLPSIQRLTSTTLPVRYGDAFFTSTISDPITNQLSRVVLYASEPVGWIRCRLESCPPQTEASPSKPPLSQIYIQALALLSPYRHLGLATMLLDAVLASSIAEAEETICIYAHVWEKNEDALDWYAKRGFKRVMLIERYYRRLVPGGAWIVRRELD
ncbi:uncharacterized protein Z518_00558 [Rhinocladiella mackenziei CBS 650.93]|uniref:N-acetyltransferase domain-containing protein n=1 Tax=Rhinocladiella mackenziei CBS 650.93 TaxID=1442369 RepID=A0A0D2HFP2_9EURO|nr:uncharacterized protein Z518_00558 [Rhinocladiella mackenziei CBS 650.93]KIX09478.1 hypothetical protein Z518_00558 [Rhinocladiella mackenziei CBS 650.93]